MSGGINRLKEHLVHKKGNVISCPKVTIEIQQKVNATLREVKKKKLDKARVHDLLQRQDEDDDVVEEQDICSGGSNRNQVRPPSFTKMIHAIGEYGRADGEEDEVDFEAHTGGEEQGEGNQDDDDVNGSDDDIDIEAGDD
ncbi:hypothetical protein IFM89_021459 [Coptis chinensis]|uniref:Uncharacterized protein n=1 Tax=Coptis chinensis TaxID=261450 RepID=A0A835IPA0_9MAGN|nr:hypothetical protein IFM89_021459 [Coptis chinensis]